MILNKAIALNLFQIFLNFITKFQECRGEVEWLDEHLKAGRIRSDVRIPISKIRSCSGLKCRAGRVCSIVGSSAHPKEICICNNPENCKTASNHHSEPLHGNLVTSKVCGSNGRFYSSHCELHSMACVTKTHISVMKGHDHCLMFESYGMNERKESWQAIAEGDLGDEYAFVLNTNQTNIKNGTKSIEVMAKLGTFLKLHCLGFEEENNFNRREINRNRPSNQLSINYTINKEDNIPFTWTKDGNIIRWLKNGELVVQDEFLMLRDVTYLNTGIYTCSFMPSNKLAQNMHILSKYKLIVQSPPLVSIFPFTQFHTPGQTIHLQCHVISQTPPTIAWYVNEEPLNLSLTKYQLSNGNRTLEITGASHITDTGAYKCVANNGLFAAQDISTVFVEDAHNDAYDKETRREEVFLLLTRSGVKVLDPGECKVQPISFQLSTHLSSHVFRHGHHKVTFRWTSAVTVRGKYLYVSVKGGNYILRIDINNDRNAKTEKIHANNCTPRNLKYFSHIDEVWGECRSIRHTDRKFESDDDDDDDGGDDDDDGGFISSVVVIKSAGEEERHVANFINMMDRRIRKIFVPPENDYNINWSFIFLLASINNNDNDINSNKRINNTQNNHYYYYYPESKYYNFNDSNRSSNTKQNVEENRQYQNDFKQTDLTNNKNNNNNINKQYINNNNNINKQYNNNNILFLFNPSSKQIITDVSVDLTNHRCVPEQIHYVLFGGKAMIECSTTNHHHQQPHNTNNKPTYLLIDTTTLHLEIIQLPPSLRYKLSPDSKLLTGISTDLTCLIVYQITSDGMLEEITNTAIMDWEMDDAIFLGSPLGGYDVAVMCSTNQEILKFDVREKRVDILNKKSKSSMDTKSKHHFVSSGFLGNFIMTSTGKDELILLDVWNNSEKCHWSNTNVDVILWLDPIRL